MATFLTKIQKNTSSFKANIKDHMALIDEMRSLEKRTVEKSEQRKPLLAGEVATLGSIRVTNTVIELKKATIRK